MKSEKAPSTPNYQIILSILITPNILITPTTQWLFSAEGH